LFMDRVEIKSIVVFLLFNFKKGVLSAPSRNVC